MSDTHTTTSPAPPRILQIANVDKVFHAMTGPVRALHGIDLEIKKGEFVCLLGASGCGKSTLLRMIAGFEPLTSGTLEIYGTPVVGPGPGRGMVFQDYALFPWLNVRENIEFGPKHTGLSRKALKSVSDRFLDMVGLVPFAGHYPHQLSGGMKQRVAIARVLANDSDLLLMDEPFGALDALTRTKLQEELLEIWEATGLTVVFVTHSVEEAVMLGDRVLVMSAGPGRIDSDIPINLSRPRDVSSGEFNAIRRDITQRLRSNLTPDRILQNAAEA